MSFGLNLIIMTNGLTPWPKVQAGGVYQNHMGSIGMEISKWNSHGIYTLKTSALDSFMCS